MPLRTYASWTNPIEKLWRKLQQDILHLHPFEDDLDSTKQAVTMFLDQFAHGSSDLLRYVGLQNPAQLYRSLSTKQFGGLLRYYFVNVHYARRPDLYRAGTTLLITW